jgi:hypothetical protein
MKEWVWDGPEPMNTRQSSFVAIVKNNSVIKMSNAGMNPTDFQIYLSMRRPRSEGGSPNNW